LRNTENTFHLAIPCADLEAAKEFYSLLGCEIARSYQDRITINFFGDQLVCHLSPEKIDLKPEMYPRHFGVTFRHKKDFDQTLALARARELDFFEEPKVRFAAKPEEHHTFFLKDPSNNLLEFKHYLDPKMMY
jgi:extradiol dioxygenase family protein